jgi:hypothetical protein
MDYRLWTLNAVTKHFQNDTQWNFKDANQKTLTMNAAQRDPLVNRPSAELGAPTARTQLMHEGTKVDEYWLPLPIKCFGDPAVFRAKWLDTSDAAKVTLFDGIMNEYKAQFDQLASYWTGPAHDRRTKMGTTPSLGLYDILQNYSKADDIKNILVGYSEGGVVARFLSFIDEHLSKRPIIKGCITVHSPNAGAVFATPRNADRVVAGLLSVSCAAPVLDTTRFGSSTTSSSARCPRERQQLSSSGSATQRRWDWRTGSSTTRASFKRRRRRCRPERTSSSGCGI